MEASPDYTENTLNDVTNVPVIASPSQARKKSRNPQNWKCNKVKHLRNSGKEYVSRKNKQIVAAPTIGEDCRCRLRCYRNVGDANIAIIFRDYWATGDWNTQTCYIQNQTEINKCKRRRVAGDENQDYKKTCTRKFYVKIPTKIEKIRVCKKAFARIHGISNGRIDWAQNNKTASDVPIKDRRGRYGHHNQVSQIKIRLVMKHIESFPTMTSHYSRATYPDAKYISTEVRSTRQMWDLYKDWLDENEVGELQIPVTEHYYRDIMNANFPNLKVYKPRSDTCKTCDKFKIDQHSSYNLSEAELKNLKTLQEIHLRKAQQGNDMYKELCDKCKSIKSKLDIYVPLLYFN